MAAALTAASAAPALGAPASSSAIAKTIVLEPLTLLNTAPLSFGNIAPGPQPGTVTVSPLGVPLYTGGATGVGGDVGAARFLIYVAGGRTARVGTPKKPIMLTRIGGGATMQVTAFTDLARKVRIQGSTDVYEFAVGGTLSVGAGQAEGFYQGQVDVTFDYN